MLEAIVTIGTAIIKEAAELIANAAHAKEEEAAAIQARLDASLEALRYQREVTHEEISARDKLMDDAIERMKQGGKQDK